MHFTETKFLELTSCVTLKSLLTSPRLRFFMCEIRGLESIALSILSALKFSEHMLCQLKEYECNWTLYCMNLLSSGGWRKISE